MNLEDYFMPALALGQLLQQLNTATGDKRAELEQKILHSEYIEKVQTMQSMSKTDFLEKPFPEKQLNYMRRDYIINTAVPSAINHDKTKPAMSSGYHQHDYYEFVFVLKGTYVQFVNGVRYLHHAGDICILPPNIMHREEALGLDDRTLFIGVSCDFFKAECMQVLRKCPQMHQFFATLLSKTGQLFAVIHMDDMEWVEKILLVIFNEDAEKKCGHHMVIKGVLLRLLDQIINVGKHAYICQTEQERQQNLSSEILAYMELHMNTISREQLAKFFHFNEDYINRFLKQTTGRTYSENLREIRMKQAAELLQSGASSRMVMEKLGLSNKGHFNRMFVQTFGVLPGEYRKQKE